MQSPNPFDRLPFIDTSTHQKDGGAINILNRFLRIKPASCVIVVTKRRDLMRGYMIGTLRKNAGKGLRDLAVHPENPNYVTGRLGSENGRFPMA
jgi:hypothetical protein